MEGALTLASAVSAHEFRVSKLLEALDIARGLRLALFVFPAFMKIDPSRYF